MLLLIFKSFTIINLNFLWKFFYLAAFFLLMSLTQKIIEELRKDEKLKEKFMTYIAEGISTRPEIRGIIVSAVLRDVATKSDIKELKEGMEAEIERVRMELKEYIDAKFSSLDQRISSLEQRISRVEGQLSLFIKMFIAFNVPILVGIIGILLKTYIP